MGKGRTRVRGGGAGKPIGEGEGDSERSWTKESKIKGNKRDTIRRIKTGDNKYVKEN
jgi:hypothetical protein